MNRKEFIKQTLLLSAVPLLPAVKGFVPSPNTYTVRLLRHATLVIEFGGKVFMVDPMLAAKDAMDPVQNAENTTRIPMVDLPVDAAELKKIITNADALLITHTHRDHWDSAAQNSIPKNKTIFCQPADADKIRSQGFTSVIPIDINTLWNGIAISRTNGQHGTGEIGLKMGNVSGFVLKNTETSVYIAGDTIYCDEVKTTLATHKPATVIVNAGGAKFITGGPITMGITDIENVCAAAPDSALIAVHMDTVNHCLVTRKILKAALEEKKLLPRVKIPEDGELITL